MEVYIFLGAPGSGKGTQAKRITQKSQAVQLSTGDLLRSHIRAKTQVGLQAQSYMDQGLYVPDELMIQLLREEITKSPPGHKVILDGFPRTLDQAVALDKSASITVRHVFYFMIPKEQLVLRLTGRRICSHCGASYHIDFLPPKSTDRCDVCAQPLIQRVDDLPEVVNKRLDVFYFQNDKLLEYYRSAGKLITIDADRAVESILQELVRYF